jgi:hypothetical protein
MKLKLSKSDLSFLKEAGVHFIAENDLKLDEALSLLDEVHDIEIKYANSDKKSDLRFASIYADIADRIESQII